MTIKPILNKILRYYNNMRGAGHTSAMLNIQTAEQPIILVKDKSMSRYIDDLIGRKLKYMSLLEVDRLDSLNGNKSPLLIDHYTLQDIFTRCMEEIMVLETTINQTGLQLYQERKNNEMLQQENEKLKDENFKYLITGRLCMTGIDNLINKNNFLQLCNQLAENFITEEEFQQEIETNPEKYINNPHKPLNDTELFELIKIVKNFHREFTIDAVEEIFSVSNLSSVL